MEILVIEDHPLLRNGIANNLRDMLGVVSVLEAATFAQARKHLEYSPGVALVLLDLGIQDSSGLETLRRFRLLCDELACYPRVVVVSGNENIDLVACVLKEHATGFIPKGVSEGIFRNAIRLTLDGGVYIPELILQNFDSPHTVPPAILNGSANDGTDGSKTLPKLTEMERLVAAYCVQGLTYKNIARAISEKRGRIISDLTVKTHVKNLSIKLGIQNEGKAAVVAQISRLKLLFPSPFDQAPSAAR